MIAYSAPFEVTVPTGDTPTEGTDMTFRTDQSIQAGWTVCASDGEQLGTVISVDSDTIHVKKGGLFGGQLDVPRTAVDEVETGRVELSMTKAELRSSR
jgi:hypothetical protein